MSAKTYRADIRRAARLLFFGVEDQFSFFSRMLNAIRTEFRHAFVRGAKRCGVKPSEFTPVEVRQIDTLVNQHMIYTTGLATDIIRKAASTGSAPFVRNTKEARALLSQIFNRLDMWVNRLKEIEDAGLSVCEDPKLLWTFGDAEHCRDCLRYDGRVYRQSVWDKYDIKPQGRNLACHGYNCKCRRDPTNRPVTPGRPPAPTG